METVDRVHIAPLGFEYDRVLEPAREYRADVIYLLVHDDPTAAQPDYHDDLVTDLMDAGVEVRTEDVDIHDVYDVLGVVTTLAAKHAGDSVLVNVSTGGYIAAIGATIACMDVDTDATAYYVEPAEYEHRGVETPRTSGVAADVELPTYPVDSPTHDQVAVMAYLAERAQTTARPKKKDVIAHAEDEELGFVADRDPANDKAKFRLLENEVVGPLREEGFLTEEEVGRRRVLELTERGENALRAFRHKLTYD